MNQRQPKRAGISVDVDSVTSHLRGYGFFDSQDQRSVYEIAIPRMLNVFSEEKARATFFVIVQEALQFPEVLQTILKGGHEIACHSMTHPIPFPAADSEEFAREICGAKIELEKLIGQKVFGFRAPGWDIRSDIIEQLVASGYRYDASRFPSWMLRLLRRAVAKRGGKRISTHATSDQLIGISEIAISCSVPGQIPYYQTMKFLLPKLVFSLTRALTWWRAENLNYIFHASDFLGLSEDGLDPRFARHPGMTLSLVEKLELARDELKRLGRCWELVPLNELIE